MIANLGKMGGQAKGPQGQPAEIPQNQLQPGEPGGHTEFALQAIQALHKYLTATTDPNEIAVIRSIIVILTKLIEVDQQRQTAQLPQDAQIMQQANGQGSSNGIGAMMGGMPGQ